MQKSIAAGIVAGALIVAGAGASILGIQVTNAADPTAAPAATAGTSTNPTTPNDNCDLGNHGGRGGAGGLDADDLTAAAKALGMTEADLTAALNGGQTPAEIAKAKGVDLQKVIDAIVAVEKTEIAAAVKAGTMTQAQADERIANLAAHVTDEVNGVAGGPGGPGGMGGDGGRGHGHGGPSGHGPDGAPGATPSTGTGG